MAVAAVLVSEAIPYTLRVAGVLGVGQSALAQDTADTLTAMQLMLAQWQRSRWVVFRLDDAFVPVTAWTASYTVGPGGDIDIGTKQRPGTIESAFLRQVAGTNAASFPIDFPLRRIWSKEAWNRIPLKMLGSWPAQFFYDPTLPLGTFYIWPVPIQHFFEIHISAAEDIAAIDETTDLEELQPDEAEEALVYSLATRLRINYALPPRPDLIQLAMTTLRTLRTNNFQMRPLQMPAALRRQTRFKNPMAGFYPEAAASVPFPVLA